jgi:hypothetical protein
LGESISQFIVEIECKDPFISKFINLQLLILD